MDIVTLLRSLDGREKLAGESEADTRARVIDPILASLGWTGEDVLREPYSGWTPQPGFVDYLLFVRGRPFMVVEVKKDSRPFGLPTRFTKAQAATLEKLIATCSDDLREALDQCTRYALHTGAAYACASNGREWIFFKPYHQGRAHGAAKVVIFSSIADALSRIDAFEDLLARSRVESAGPEKQLIGWVKEVPEFASRLNDSKHPTGFRTVESEEYAKLVDLITRQYLVDIRDDAAFRRCYVHVPSLKTTDDGIASLLRNQSQSISALPDRSIGDRFAGAFLADATDNSAISSLTGRTVILHGAIGVGKTSYLRHLELDSERRRKRELLWARLDLLEYRDRPFGELVAKQVIGDIAAKLRDTLSEAAQGLRKDVDPEEWKHLRDIYGRESHRFQKSRYPDSDDSDPVYLDAAREYVFQLKEKDPREHLVRVLEWLTKKQRIPAVVVLDNSDQLGLDFQEFLYDLASELDRRTASVTIICLRTEALLSHRIRANAVARIEDRYEVRRPPLVRVLKERVRELEETLEPEIKKQTKNRKLLVAFERIWSLLHVLLKDFENGGHSASLIEQVGNGDYRRALAVVSLVFKQDPKTMDTLVADVANNPDRARISPEYVVRALMYGGQTIYRGTVTALVPNVFAVERAQREPHLLVFYVLRLVQTTTTTDATPTVAEVVALLAMAGFDPEVARNAVEKGFRGEMLAVPHMFDEIRDTDRVRVTPLGEAILGSFCRERAYYDALVWDTVIYDANAFHELEALSGRRGGGAKVQTLRERFVKYLDFDRAQYQHTLNPNVLPAGVLINSLSDYASDSASPRRSYIGDLGERNRQPRPQSKKK